MLNFPSVLLVFALALAACGPRYSPDSYATRAVQQANKVEQATVVGRRQVKVSAEGSTGAATGATAGGVLGAQAPGAGIMAALGGVGGALVGGLVGTAAEHTVVDTRAYEYVVRTAKGELLSVTQSDTTPLAIGQNVLLIAGNQARIVPDYTFEPAVLAARAGASRSAPPPAEPPASAEAAAAPAAAATESAPTADAGGSAGGGARPGACPRSGRRVDTPLTRILGRAARPRRQKSRAAKEETPWPSPSSSPARAAKSPAWAATSPPPSPPPAKLSRRWTRL